MEYQGKTIVGLAHERGASGNVKKRDTAWKYLIEHMQKPVQIENKGYRIVRTEGKDMYKKMEWVKRVRKNGDEICRIFGYLTRVEASAQAIADGKYTEEALLPEHIEKRKIEQEKIEYMKKRNYYSLKGFPREAQNWNDGDYLLKIAGRLIKFHRSDSASWSGKYRACRWPDSTSITRTASLMRLDCENLSAESLLKSLNIVEKKINYEARGKWLINTVCELLEIKPVPVRGKSHIQLDNHFTINLSRKIGNVEIWERKLAGELYDYCAVRGKDTYHADTQLEAIQGLQRKLALPGMRHEKIDMNYAISLGFCRSGVVNFCEDYGLDEKKIYSRTEIQQKISEGNGLAEKYERELEKAGFVH